MFISQKDLITDAIQLGQARQEYDASLAENTANVHMLNHLQLLRTLGLRDTNIPDIDLEVSKLKQLTEDRTEHNKIYKNLVDKSEQVKKSQEASDRVSNVQGKWAKRVGRVELWFVIFGTLQWGYGNKWVETLKDIGFYDYLS